MTRHHRRAVHAKNILHVNKRGVWVIDKLTYFAAFAEPLVTAPQVYEIFRHQDATGVSISTWSGFEILSFVWILYSLVHKERVILIYQGLFAIFQGAVIIGAILYGGKF